MAAKNRKQDGYYRRPSAALEQGGSFYVPGLEGTRLRTAGAVVLSVGLLLNRVLSPGEPVTSQYISEAFGVFGCLVVFAQSAAQNRVDSEMEQDALRAAFAARLKERQDVAESLPTLTTERARWAAATMLKVTPARAVVWVGADGAVLARCGRFPEPTSSEPAAMDAVDVQPLLALMAEDATAGSLLAEAEFTDAPPAPLPRNAASALLCRCGDGGSVLAIASEQPFAFSERHARWLQDCASLLTLSP